MSQEECEAESLFTLIAGSDSTASTIRSILVHTISCPRVYSRLKQEIKDKLDSKDNDIPCPIGIEEVKTMSYIEVGFLSQPRTKVWSSCFLTAHRFTGNCI